MGIRAREAPTNRLEIALGGGAGIWLFLLAVGFFAPGGWHWGWPESIGHMVNYMNSLCPLFAMRDPLHNTAAIQVYLLGLVAIMVSSIRAERPKLAGDGLPIIIAAISIGSAIGARPKRSQLWRW